MKKRPRALILLSLFLLGVAVSFPIQVVMLYDHSNWEIRSLVTMFTPLNWLTVILCFAASILVFQASSGALIVVPVLLLTVLCNNWVVGRYANDFSSIQTALATIVFFFVHLLILHEPALLSLQNPQQRWWKVSARKKMTMPIMINPFKGLPFKAATFNISKTGAFIPIPVGKSNLKEGDLINIGMKFGLFSELRCGAQVTRVTNSKGIYPGGIGIQFTDMDRHSHRELNRLLALT